MDIIEAIYQRRSVRDYAEEPIAREALQQLVDAAIQAPSAMNEQPWHFTIVTEQELLNRISSRSKTHMLAMSSDVANSKHYRMLLSDENFHLFYHAPALIVISAPSNSRWAREDCALAAQNLMLAAHAMKLGTCWIGFAQAWLGTEEGRNAIGIPESLLPIAPIIVGHPRSAAHSVSRKRPDIRWID
jgi:nitroreductase